VDVITGTRVVGVDVEVSTAVICIVDVVVIAGAAVAGTALL
jgi:hypothetical protein